MYKCGCFLPGTDWGGGYITCSEYLNRTVPTPGAVLVRDHHVRRSCPCNYFLFFST